MPQLVKKSEVAYFYGSNQQSMYLRRMFPTSWTATTAYATAEEVWGKVSGYSMMYGFSFNGPQDNRYITGLTNTNPITCATDCKRFAACFTQSTTACTSFSCSMDSCSKDTCSKDGICGTDCTKYTPCPSYCFTDGCPLDGVCLSDCPPVSCTSKSCACDGTDSCFPVSCPTHSCGGDCACDGGDTCSWQTTPCPCDGGGGDFCSCEGLDTGCGLHS